ncbi:MAG TPA: helix-hairpin-helix domain-containing protein [Flavisolibacter sp.]|nr:helix-hairpin-helix domain-containing protein [Flavisolibacter sp.]
MNNDAIADQLSLLSKLMDIHGENSFKTKSYASAAFTIEKLPEQLSTLSKEKISSIRGIGESVGSKIMELLETNELKLLDELISATPEGVLEMMNIKGLGSKKINVIWKELNITTVDELRTACKENRIAEKKGFGEKTQEKILEALAFNEQTSGSYLYARLESFVAAFKNKIAEEFGGYKLEVTGSFRRQLEVIDKLEWVTTIPKKELKRYLTDAGMNVLSESNKTLVADSDNTLVMEFHLAQAENFITTLFKTSCHHDFLEAFIKLDGWDAEENYEGETDIFKSVRLQKIPPFIRETSEIITLAKVNKVPKVIQTGDVKGLIHSHSNWSDGASTIEEMAVALVGLGFEYLVISDHSKAAFYANGLNEQRIKEQHKYIDTINKKLAPFKIFKSIECDILSDGALDYSAKVLASFDLVIASVHSNLQMKEEKAMMRLLSAVENPYITILGHPTGRRLLKRPAYPVDHKALIDACALHGVVIEINANPQRLDMKWEWVSYALSKNLFLSINPDAHTINEFQNIKYGVLVAQKGGLTKEGNLSSFSLEQFEEFLQQRRKLKGI